MESHLVLQVACLPFRSHLQLLLFLNLAVSRKPSLMDTGIEAYLRCCGITLMEDTDLHLEINNDVLSRFDGDEDTAMNFQDDEEYNSFSFPSELD